MRRRHCRAFNLAAVVSALLFAAVCALWARSEYCRDQWSCHLSGPWYLHIVSYVGGLYVVVDDEWHGGDHVSSSKIVWSRPQDYGDDEVWCAPNWREVLGYGLEHYWAAGGFVFTNSRRFGFLYTAAGSLPPDYGFYHVKAVVVPDWFLLLLLSLPLLRLGWARWRKARRVSSGRCPGCGYDLRATPTGGGALLGRCPECGTVPAKGAGT